MAEFAAHGANQEEKMAAEKAKKTIVIGHKNPDTDSICSAIGYANFKTLQTGGEYVPCRAGELNPETTFVLDYFKVGVPKLIKSVKTQTATSVSWQHYATGDIPRAQLHWHW